MTKTTTRPLLVKAVREALEAEELAYQGLQQATLLASRVLAGWHPVAAAKEEWDRARLTRAQAELQLWLADRQWEQEEREEQEERKAAWRQARLEREAASENASPTGKT